MTKQQTAVMYVLVLRGAQTIGEIKSRSYRIYEFENLAQTEQILDELITIENGPFVIKLPKDSGRENRFTHLFCGEPERQSEIPKEPSVEERITALEEKVNSLEEKYIGLKDELENFKKSFE